MKEMNEQNNSINGLMKSLQDQLNGESTTQKVDVQQNQISNQQGGTLPGEAALASVDAHNTSINAVQQNDFTNGAATALLQTIINQSSSEILSDNNAAKGGAPGAMDPQYTLPDLHELGGALQQNGTIHTQQNPSYVINSDSNYNTDQGQTVTVVDQGFCHSVASENPNNLQTFLVNQTPNSDLHVITENHLNQVNLSTFEGLAQVNAKVLDSSECLSDKPVLEQLLTDRKLSDNISSPELQNACSPTSSANSPYTEANGQETSFIDHASQGLTYTEMAPMTIDTSTQSSLIARSEKLVLVDSPYQGATVIEDKDKNIAWDVTKIDDHELEQIGKPKMMKLGQDNDAPSSVLSPSVERVFESAMQGLSPEFTFHKFGQIDADQGFFQFGAEKKELEGPSSPPITFKTPHPPGYGARLQSALKARKREQARRSREPILSQQFPPRHQNYELKILSQPEEQHRARYLTEGSRGAVKNRSGQSYPSVKLLGHSGEATLQVFVGNDSGRVRPHGFYQACKVCGKNSTPCHEKDIDGTTVIEIDLKSSNDMTAAIDCVGILKLRNADVEQRIGLAKAKKKSTKARMVFRVTFQKPCGSPQVLQVASAPILCTQPIGQPEICKMSLKECSSSGGEELYVIGKNFLRGTRVFFQEVNEEDKCLWEGEGEIDKDYFQTTHMIVTIPEYGHSLQPGCKVQCQVVANSGGKVSDPQSFTYRADELKPAVKQEVIPMDISEESRKRNYPFVAPEALELNQQIQQTSQSSELFQMPPGVLSGVIQQQNNNNTTNTHTNMEEAKTYQSPPQQTHIPETVTETEQLNLNTVGYSVNPNMFNTDTMSNTQTQAWENKPTEPAKGYTTMESESAEGIFPMNTDENYTDQTFESSLNRIKSPRMSTDTYQTEHGLTSSIFSGESVNMNTSSEISSGDNMINQLLQNLHDSDPMLGSSSHNASANPAGQSLGQTSGTYFSAGPNSSGTQKPEDQQCSRLKEALTCPPSSLQEFSNFANIANSNLAVAPDTTHNACDSVVMNEADKDKMNASFTASPHQNATFSPSQSVYSPEQAVPSPTTNGALQTSFNQVEQNVPSPATSIMFQTSFPQQSDMTASVTYSTAPSSTQLSSQGLVVNSDNTNTQSINTSDQFSQLFNNVVNSATLHTPLIQEGSLQQSGTQLPVSHGVTSTTSNIVTQSQQVYHNNQSIGFSSPQQQQLQAAAAHLSSQSSESIVINPANPSNHNVSSGTTLTAIQQLLQQSVHQSLQQQPQISQQMGANQIGVLTSAQTNIVPSPQAALQAQPLYPAQTNFGLSTQASAAAQTPPSSAQTQNSAPVLQTQTPAFTPAPATSNQTGFTSSTPSIPQKAETFNTTGSVQPPVAGPQIIICNPGQQPAQPTTGFGGAPSIVIMPAQNGQNNQVESLLRSILGSMMGQPQQSQQQQQQTQPPANQQ